MEKHEFITVVVIGALAILASNRVREVKLSQATLPELAKHAFEIQHEQALAKIYEDEFPRQAPHRPRLMGNRGSTEPRLDQATPVQAQEGAPAAVEASPLAMFALPAVLPELEGAPARQFHLFDLDLRLPPRVIIMPFSAEYEVAAPVFYTDDDFRLNSTSKVMRLYL